MGELRLYQTSALLLDREARENGARVVALVMPCGAGKTRTAAGWAALRKGTGVWVAHRTELLDQAEATVDPETGARTIFATVQSFLGRSLPDAEWYVLDEGHHLYGTPMWSAAVAIARRGPTLVLTATPARQDGSALGNLADAIVAPVQPSELIRDGHLVTSRVLAPPKAQQSLADDPAKAYLTYGEKRPAIVFCRDVRHAEKVSDDLVAAGVRAQWVEGDTDPELRRHRIEGLREGWLDVLCNVQILTEGTDIPRVSCVVMATGCGSRSAWIQRTNRAMRAYPGKTDALVIDLKGAVFDWGLPHEDRTYSLEGEAIGVKRPDEESIRQCRWCGGIFLASLYVKASCPQCGKGQPVREHPAVRKERLAAVAAAEPQEARAEFLRKMQAIARMRGYKSFWALARYKAKYGAMPGGRA